MSHLIQTKAQLMRIKTFISVFMKSAYATCLKSLVLNSTDNSPLSLYWFNKHTNALPEFKIFTMYTHIFVYMSKTHSVFPNGPQRPTERLQALRGECFQGLQRGHYIIVSKSKLISCTYKKKKTKIASATWINKSMKRKDGNMSINTKMFPW